MTRKDSLGIVKSLNHYPHPVPNHHLSVLEETVIIHIHPSSIPKSVKKLLPLRRFVVVVERSWCERRGWCIATREKQTACAAESIIKAVLRKKQSVAVKKIPGDRKEMCRECLVELRIISRPGASGPKEHKNGKRDDVMSKDSGCTFVVSLGFGIVLAVLLLFGLAVELLHFLGDPL